MQTHEERQSTLSGSARIPLYDLPKPLNIATAIKRPVRKVILRSIAESNDSSSEPGLSAKVEVHHSPPTAGSGSSPDYESILNRPYRTWQTQRFEDTNVQISRPIVNRSSSLQTQFASLLNRLYFGQRKMKQLRPFLDFIPSRLGSSPVMDTAVECILAGHAALTSEGDASLERVSQVQYSKALLTLKRVIEREQLDHEHHLETLAAILILMYYEIMLGPTTGSYMMHARAASHLMVVIGNECLKSAFGRAVAFAQFGCMTAEALVQKSSLIMSQIEWKNLYLYSDFWPDLSPHFSRPECTMIYEIMLRQFSSLPALVDLVRSLHAGLADRNALAEGAHRAETLYLEEGTTWVPRVLASVADVTPTRVEFEPEIIPLSYTWNDAVLTYMCCRFWATRILHLALLRRLYLSGVPASPLVTKHQLRIDVLIAVREICANCGYAATLKPEGHLFMIWNLEMAFAALYWDVEIECGPEDELLMKRKEEEQLQGWIIRTFMRLFDKLATEREATASFLTKVADDLIPPISGNFPRSMKVAEALVINSIAYA